MNPIRFLVCVSAALAVAACGTNEDPVRYDILIVLRRRP
jgi:hypothetical protein